MSGWGAMLRWLSVESELEGKRNEDRREDDKEDEREKTRIGVGSAHKERESL